MKELDLTNAVYLKKYLSLVYGNWDIEHIVDICELTRKCLVATLLNILVLLLGLCVVGIIILMLLPFTTLLPESLQFAVFEPMLMGLVVWGVILFFGTMLSVGATLKGEMKFAPDYITKHFKSDTEQKEKKPSQTWIAIKEMYTGFKDKTCIKVKMK